MQTRWIFSPSIGIDQTKWGVNVFAKYKEKCSNNKVETPTYTFDSHAREDEHYFALQVQYSSYHIVIPDSLQ